MIARNWTLELEQLISGTKDSIELTVDLPREEIVEEINHLVASHHPGTWMTGEFMNPDESDYLVYDLHISGAKNFNFSSIRLLDFGDKFLLVRV
ncbi:MAG: hypothetical protein NDI94_03345 [Candidatus Woesearchaeota archaeon]|nr:hypothetical protein [Candidatus Woesearchaeota archaeon]